MRIDLHSHSSVSDGLDAPAALVRKMGTPGSTRSR
jgi:predicted metal-dependent phosphoesterase TrpH